MEEVSLCLGLLMTLEVGSGTVGVLSSCLSSTLTLEGVREWEIGGGGIPLCLIMTLEGGSELLRLEMTWGGGGLGLGVRLCLSCSLMQTETLLGL